MGRCTCPPVVKLNPSVDLCPKLLWFPVTKKGRSAGEALLAAELLLKDKVKRCQMPNLKYSTLYMKLYLGGDAVLCPLGE